MSDFWSRRRAAVEAEEIAEKAVAEAVPENADASDEELLAEAGLLDPDLLDTPDQVKEFLQSALPQRLKNRALRKLWGMNPVLANVDGLVDYGEDFTDAARVVENMQTLYQVGKGMFDKLTEAEVLETDAPANDVDEATPDADPEEALPEQVALSEPESEAEVLDTPGQMDPEPELANAAPRRMRFRFDT